MKSRLWCGTNFDLDLDWHAIFAKGDCKYIAYGDETCPTTNKSHQQFFVLFHNQRSSMKNVSKLFGNCHVEPCKGSLQQNERYCSKEGELVEFGERPAQGQRNDIEECMAMVKEGASELEIALAAPRLWCQYGRRFEDFRALLQPDREWKTECRVWWGPPGSGKSRAAREWLGEYDDVTYTPGGFFIGYHNHENVLLEDFDYKSMPRDIFLQITDRYKTTANVKNGEKKFNAKRIAITSNFDPREWYNWGDPEAITRRMSEIIFLDGSQVMAQK